MHPEHETSVLFRLVDRTLWIVIPLYCLLGIDATTALRAPADGRCGQLAGSLVLFWLALTVVAFAAPIVDFEKLTLYRSSATRFSSFARVVLFLVGLVPATVACLAH
jgi:hypothetical protein